MHKLQGLKRQRGQKEKKGNSAIPQHIIISRVAIFKSIIHISGIWDKGTDNNATHSLCRLAVRWNENLYLHVFHMYSLIPEKSHW